MDPVFAKSLVSVAMVISVAAFSLMSIRQALAQIVRDLRNARTTDPSRE